MSAVLAAPPAIVQARAIVREVMTSPWPDSREAMHAIGYARDYAAGEIEVYEIEVYWQLRSGDLDWWKFDADLAFFGGDPQREAISIAADRALDAARAALRMLREYQRRVAAGLAHASRSAS